ncbi:hypothetical protein UPYG_G00244310 [Umbra pygmaea]|uniref:C2H2-type domain-containing protein n=1 Tax=Umbra pygmaea TaxID=75934 RepID=A0ABD0X274_UMBPY
MPRKKQYQPQRLGLQQSHGGNVLVTNPLPADLSVKEMRCAGDTQDPQLSLTLRALAPLPPSASTTLNPQDLCPPVDPTSRHTHASSAQLPQGSGQAMGLGGLSQGPVDNPLDKDLSLPSILALLCGGNPLQGLGGELATSPPLGLEPGASAMGEPGRMQGGRREGEGDSSPPLGLLPDVPPLSQHALQLSALAQRVAKNSLSSFKSSSSPAAAARSQQQVSGCSTADQGRPAALEVGPSRRCSWAGKDDRLSPDSAIQRLRAAAANVALHNRGVTAPSSPALSSSSSGGVALQEESCLTLDPGPLASASSASFTLAVLSQRVNQSGQVSKVTGSERSDVTSTGQQFPTSFPCLLSLPSPAPQSSSGAGENHTPKVEIQTQAENQAMPLSACKIQGPSPQPQTDSNTKPSTPPVSLGTLLTSNPLVASSPGGHTGVYQCAVCGLQMKRRSYWRRHMSVHTGLKSQQCHLCPFRCARKDNLTAHMKVHTQKEKGEEFQCDLCPFTSPRLFSLKLHMRCHQRAGANEPTQNTAGTGPGGAEQAVWKPGSLGLAPPSTEAPNCPGASRGRDNADVCVKEEPQDRQVSAPCPLQPPSLSSLFPSLSPLTHPLAPKRNRRRARTPPHSPSALKRRPGTPHTHAPGILTHTPLMVPMATSLFSPDICTKAASDLLIKLSAATQMAELKPGHLVKQEAQEEVLVPGHEQQGAEPGLALSPDGPGASPEPPTHLSTPTEAVETEKMMLEQDIGVTVASELLRRLSEKQEVVVHGLKVKEEDEPMEVDQVISSVTPDPVLTPGERVGPMRVKDTSSASQIPKEEDLFQKELFSQDISVKMASALLYQLSEKLCKANEQKQSRASSSPVEKTSSTLSTSPSPPDQHVPANPTPDQHVSALPSPDSLPPVGYKYRCPVCSYQAQCQSNLNHHLASHTAKTSSWNYYYRCHMCGFELEGRSQFLSHMMEHSEWEQDAFTLRCSVCDHSTNEERAMRLHASSHSLPHTPGETASEEYIQRHLCPLPEFSTSCPVSMVTHMRSPHSATDQHLCSICQRSFPGQHELQAHIRGHRQGNQYRCESAKRRDSLRLHCRLKHPDHAPSNGHTQGHAYGGHPTQRSAMNLLSSSALSSWLRGSDISPLVPLTTLLSLKPLSRPTPSSLPPSPLPKLSFLAYLGLSEQT